MGWNLAINWPRGNWRETNWLRARVRLRPKLRLRRWVSLRGKDWLTGKVRPRASLRVKVRRRGNLRPRHWHWLRLTQCSY